jgi:hypothetical protein
MGISLADALRAHVLAEALSERAGCCLHVVIDDNNINQEITQSVVADVDPTHPACVELGALLMRMSRTQRYKLSLGGYRNAWERRLPWNSVATWERLFAEHKAPLSATLFLQVARRAGAVFGNSNGHCQIDALPEALHAAAKSAGFKPDTPDRRAWYFPQRIA